MAKHAPLRIYADAYVSSLTKKSDGVGEISAYENIFSKNPIIRSYLSDSSISKKDRMEAIKIISPDAEEKTYSFIYLLGEDGLLDELDRIVEQIRKSYKRLTTYEYVKVTSAVELTRDERKRIEKALVKNSEKEIRLECHLDPTIIGGLIIQKNDWVLNSTLQGRLERLKRLLNV